MDFAKKCEKRREGMESVKILARPVEAVAVFYRGQYPMPRKFRYEERDGSRRVIDVDKILESEASWLGSVDFVVYRCQSWIDGRDVRYELKYILKEARWELYKM